jgi:outer membrane protein OmpA-like peptidoglycan-associated protein
MMSAVPAFAQSQTFNVLYFNPATGRNPYLMLHGVDTLHQWQFQVGDYLSFGYRPLEIRQANQRLTSAVNYTLVNDFIAAFGITDWLQIGVDAPFAILNQFQDPRITPPSGYNNEMAFSDIRLELKGRIIDPCNFPVGIAIIPFGTIPTGKDSVYMGDPGPTAGVRIAVEGRVTPRVGITGNVGYKWGKRVTFLNLDWQHRMLLGVGAYFKLARGLTVFGEVNAESDLGHFFSDRDMNIAEGIAGVKWDIKDTGVTLNGGVGSCFICGVKGAMARSVFGVTYRFNPPKYRQKDKDFDTICERAFGKMLTAQEYYELKLKCPPDPADFQEGVHDDACPKYYELREIAELLWRCPAKPEDYKPGVHDAACQKVYVLMDKYSEEEIWSVYTLSAAEMGLRCPQDPANFNAAIHDQACPKYYDLRQASLLAQICPKDASDFKPGVHDDACPKFYELREQFTELEWAVVYLSSQEDSDGDGINDYLDICPEQKEDFNGFADEDGCPEGGVVSVIGGEIRTYQPVYFAFNRSDMSSEAELITDLVIKTINETPWIKKVRVAGNTDAIGSEEANVALSKRRAQRVIDYMRRNGVRSNVKLIPVAYGEAKPVASNDTEEGRALNRRVVFAIANGTYVPRGR